MDQLHFTALNTSKRTNTHTKKSETKNFFTFLLTSQKPCGIEKQAYFTYIHTYSLKPKLVHQKFAGSGLPSMNDLNSTSDLSGCEKGASCEAPLTVANETMFP